MYIRTRTMLSNNARISKFSPIRQQAKIFIMLNIYSLSHLHSPLITLHLLLFNVGCVKHMRGVC